MRRKIRWVAVALVAGSVWQGSTKLRAQQQQEQPPVQATDKKHGRSPGGDIGSGSGDIGKGAGGTAGNGAKAAGNLVTLHPVGAGKDVGKAGKDAGVGAAKGTGKIVKGTGRGIKHIF